MFEKFAEDVMIRYQQKLAALAKMAEGEQIPDLIPQTQEEQNAEQFSNNIRSMTPIEAANALDFEDKVTGPVLRDDLGESEPGARTSDKSPVTGKFRGIPQRYAETGLGMAAGINLSTPSVRDDYSDTFTPITKQYNALSKQPYSKGFKANIDRARSKSDVRSETFPLASALYDGAVNPFNKMQLFAFGRNPDRNINDIIRRLYNFY